MKKIIKITAPLLLLFVAIGCGNRDYVVPSTFSDAGFYSTYGKGLNKSAVVGDYATFQDISQGAIFHTWEIEEGNEILTGPIAQSAKTYDKYIKNPGQTKTEDKTINVLFNKGNIITKIKMFDVFNEMVTFRRDEKPIVPYPINNEGGDIVAVLQTEGPWAGKYVLEIEIIVDVYDTVVPKMILTQKGTVVDHTVAGAFIDIKAGEAVQLQDISATVPNTSRPDGRTWKFTDAEGKQVFSSQNENLSLQFKKLGIYRGTLTATRSASDNINGSSTIYEIPISFRVIQSDQPYFQSGAIKSLVTSIIQVPMSTSIEPGFADQKSFFTVKVNGVVFPVTSVNLDAVNESVVNINVGKLYPADKVTISYAGGSIKSSDDRNLVPFTDKAVTVFDPNFLGTDAGGFEDLFGATWVASNNNSGTISYSTEQKLTGTSSIKAVAQGSERARFQSTGNGTSKVFNLVAGTTYTIRYSRFVKSGGSVSGDKIFLIYPQVQINGPSSTYNAADNDQWKTYEIDYVPSSDVSGQSFYIQLNPGDGTVYYDNFYIAVKSVRP
ncbi:hypothetical protein [Flavobacterium faecale]|nr:hypothetical protein [Flavobacterium faecale]